MLRHLETIFHPYSLLTGNCHGRCLCVNKTCENDRKFIKNDADCGGTFKTLVHLQYHFWRINVLLKTSNLPLFTFGISIWLHAHALSQASLNAILTAVCFVFMILIWYCKLHISLYRVWGCPIHGLVWLNSSLVLLITLAYLYKVMWHFVRLEISFFSWWFMIFSLILL